MFMLHAAKSTNSQSGQNDYYLTTYTQMLWPDSQRCNLLHMLVLSRLSFSYLFFMWVSAIFIALAHSSLHSRGSRKNVRKDFLISGNLKTALSYSPLITLSRSLVLIFVAWFCWWCKTAFLCSHMSQTSCITSGVDRSSSVGPIYASWGVYNKISVPIFPFHSQLSFYYQFKTYIHLLKHCDMKRGVMSELSWSGRIIAHGSHQQLYYLRVCPDTFHPFSKTLDCPGPNCPCLWSWVWKDMLCSLCCTASWAFIMAPFLPSFHTVADYHHSYTNLVIKFLLALGSPFTACPIASQWIKKNSVLGKFPFVGPVDAPFFIVYNIIYFFSYISYLASSIP